MQAVPDFTVFSIDRDAGRVENITASSPQEASALVQARYPGAVTSAVPAEATQGCNHQLLLWEWMGALERAQQTP